MQKEEMKGEREKQCPVQSMQGTREVSSFGTKPNVRNVTGIRGEMVKAGMEHPSHLKYKGY